MQLHLISLLSLLFILSHLFNWAIENEWPTLIARAHALTLITLIIRGQKPGQNPVSIFPAALMAIAFHLPVHFQAAVLEWSSETK